MMTSPSTRALALLALTFPTACSSSETVGSDEGAETHVVNPDGKEGFGKFEMTVPPNTSCAAVLSGGTVNQLTISPSKEVEVPAGEYTLTLSQGNPSSGIGVTVTSGKTTKLALGALTVKAVPWADVIHEPEDAKGSYDFAPALLSIEKGVGSVSWDAIPVGKPMLVPTGDYKFRYVVESIRQTGINGSPFYDTVDRLIPNDTFHVTAGKVVELDSSPDPMTVLAVSHEVQNLPDSYSSTLGFKCGRRDNQFVEDRTKTEIRVASDVATGTCDYHVGGYMFDVGHGTVKAAPYEKGSIEVNRIEVTDPKITDLSPPVVVKGTYRLYREDDKGAFSLLGSNYATGTGIDVGKGHFKVVTSYFTPSNQHRETEEIIDFK